MSNTRRLQGKRCEVCSGGGSLHELRLLSPAELKRDFIAQALESKSNAALLCKPCHRAYLVLISRAAPDETTAPIVILYRDKLDLLIERRNSVKAEAAKTQMHLSFGSVESGARFQGRLEGI
jgi:hypothetical protein